MRIGHTHADVYDRESDYWQDIEDAQNAQMEAQKNSSKAATNGEQIQKINQNQITGILPQEDAK
ncbi:hypothetical protein JIN86_06830 [Lysinibacillus sp. HST-98]|uniref:hypothetical protein n=1 Tax=Lysinibacillus sp. HST-98 TaxID=2800419 RepID=UPI0019269D01|nr:hypothetical protein [Lysinibacillus sp. HST-98]MBL3729314.1 hypothetical protein [Lysinibacillus sp. HST-98]